VENCPHLREMEDLSTWTKLENIQGVQLQVGSAASWFGEYERVFKCSPGGHAFEMPAELPWKHDSANVP